MIGHGEKLTRKQDQAIGALLTEQTIASAAEQVGVSEPTLRRWLKLPEFLAAYREAWREIMEKTMAQMQQASWAASTTLIKLLGANNESTRLRAAVALLDQANKGLETLDHEERLAALEELSESRRHS
jgi:Helix-turn-helix domain of transposase family ISL3